MTGQHLGGLGLVAGQVGSSFLQATPYDDSDETQAGTASTGVTDLAVHLLVYRPDSEAPLARHHGCRRTVAI